MADLTVEEIAAALARCVRRYGEDSPKTDEYCNLINGDANVSAEEFNSLSQAHQDLLTRVCNFTP